MSEIEAPHIKMQLLRDEKDNILIDFEPPLSAEQKTFIWNAPEFMDIPEQALTFHSYHPKRGNRFTEVNCAPIRTALAEEKIVLDERNFAERIADILTKHGNVVEFVNIVKPVADGGYWFSGGLTTQRPHEGVWGE